MYEDPACYYAWPAVELIRDQYTDSKSSQVALTAIVLHDFAITRPAAYQYLKWKVED